MAPSPQGPPRGSRSLDLSSSISRTKQEGTPRSRVPERGGESLSRKPRSSIMSPRPVRTCSSTRGVSPPRECVAPGSAPTLTHPARNVSPLPLPSSASSLMRAMIARAAGQDPCPAATPLKPSRAGALRGSMLPRPGASPATRRPSSPHATGDCGPEGKDPGLTPHSC